MPTTSPTRRYLPPRNQPQLPPVKGPANSLARQGAKKKKKRKGPPRTALPPSFVATVEPKASGDVPLA